jgi:hypothetical protein
MHDSSALLVILEDAHSGSPLVFQLEHAIGFVCHPNQDHVRDMLKRTIRGLMRAVLEAELTSPISRKGSALSKTFFRKGERPSIGISSINPDSSMCSGIPSR